MRDPPYALTRVVGHVERAVTSDGNRDGPSPHVALRRDEARHEVDVFARRNAAVEWNGDDLVASATRSIPRPVLGGEGVHAIRGWKHRARVERHAERRRVRLEQHVRYGDLVAELGVLAFV